jgi:hypothetical protein
VVVFDEYDCTECSSQQVVAGKEVTSIQTKMNAIQGCEESI